ncbi:hypothetical protein [Serratia ureilytica]|uniref:hypothetical protein n=1 Tax=Serratia ureilytica TaxID=300181 RepID=UPI0019CFCFAC|nr:hypothetical protein [Serratia ureilytica]MBN5283340.1 hypothetical protein [Serratia ureilytica]MBN5374735.1 hypothetical protein [Serratia ureilytica]
MVQRFNPDYVMHAARFAPFARENEHGEFVKFSDYEALVSELASIRQINAQTLQVNLTMADAIKELTDRVNALAVENAALKSKASELVHEASEVYSAYNATIKEPDGDFMDMQTLHEMKCIQTPATDAALAAIQVQGVEKLIKLKMEQLASMHPDTHAFGATAESLRDQINELQAFATELREGK